ncbi:MAG: hypothetical protein PHV85_06720, partial [Desulfovibrionaceae bacterium]|nr:hypothetical protein [Desulfovibrionaceae bacterium]
MWEKAFTEASGYCWDKKDGGPCPVKAGSLGELKTILDWSHITQCLLRPYFETENYPLVEWRELLPSFEIDLFEYKQLPGFSLVAFDRPLNSFQEIFQYDVLHPFLDWQKEDLIKDACVLESSVLAANLRLFQSRLPKMLHEDFERQFGASDICGLENYFDLLPFLLHLERAHILAKDSAGEYCLTGIYASLPSELDTELKRFGMKIGKFSPGNNLRYECNRLFVYQFLMEQHGFPIVSERRTSAALFARRLLRMGENFMVRVLGQSDRTITTLSSRFRNRRYPRIEKIALVQVDQRQTEAITLLKDQGFFVDEKKRVVILRVIYKQHDYNPKNIREDRAISVQAQEIIHPLTGRVLSHLNIIKDASSMILCLNDIVRGEFQGKITYKRQEIIQ